MAGRSVSLVGRDREMSVLRTALDQARGGRGTAVMLEGEPGIGKTRLALELRDKAMKANFLVAHAAAYEADWLPPYAIWSEAVRGLGTTLIDAQPPDRRDVLLEVMPQLRGQRIAQPPPTLSLAESRFRATDAVARLLLESTEQRPLLVVLDDLQWADPPSLDVIAYLARFLSVAQLMVVGAYRSGDVGLTHPLAPVLAELDRHTACVHVPVGALRDEDALALVDRSAADLPRELAREVVREANGHPFFIIEVARHLLESGVDAQPRSVPQSIRHAVAQRLANLAPTTRRLLAVACAFTRPFDFTVLAAMTELPDEELLAAVDEALEAQLLRSVEQERYEFSHVLIRRTLYDEMGPSRRARLHRRIGQALEQVFMGRELDHAGELAAQYHASISLPGAAHGVRYAVAAAENARATHAAEQAVAALRVASDLAVDAAIQVRCDVACRLAIAEAEALLLDDAERSADAALELLEAAGASEDRVAEFVVAVARPLQQASIAAWSLYAGSGRGDLTDRLLLRGLDALGDRRDLRWARLKLLERPTARDEAGPIHSGRWLGFDPLAVRIARSDGDEDDYSSTLDSQDPRSLDETRQILALADTWTSPGAKIGAYITVLETLGLQHGALHESVGVATRMLAFSEQVGSLLGQAKALSSLAYNQERLGQFDAAARDARRADEMLSRLSLGAPQTYLPELSTETRVRRLQHVDWPVFARVYRDSALDQRGSPSYTALIEAAVAAEAFVFAGEPEEARQLLGWALPAILASEPTRLQHNGAVAFAGGAIWQLGDPQHASAVRQAALDVIDAGVGDCWHSSNELTVARMSSLLGELEEAADWFSRARAALDTSGQRPLRAIVDLDEAIHRLRHALPGAPHLLTTARKQFMSLDMSEWVTRTDATIAESSTSYPAHLTAREVEVLRRVASGLTNAEIAADFVISPHTVERHLANAYRKIGARNRAEAATYILQAGL
jgi:DNA-binding CsgD family transcriptional regulator